MTCLNRIGRSATKAVVIIPLLALYAKAEPFTWAQWRGPNRNGQVSGPAWPHTLDTNHLRQVWRVELGPSYSGPIVGVDRVFTTETKAKKSEIVTAFDRSTGKQLWRTQWDGVTSVPFFAKSNGDWIRSTPALDANRLYVAGMRVMYVNAAWLKMTGYGREQIGLKTPRLWQGKHTDQAVVGSLKQKLLNREVVHGQTWNSRKSGEPFLMDWYCYAI